MKKKTSFAILLAVVMALSVSMMAFAQPIDISTSISPNMITVEPGVVVNLTATTTVGQPGFAAVQFVSDAWSPNVYDVVPAYVVSESFVSTAKFSSLVEGTYYVTYTITLRVGASGNTDTDSDEATIIVEEGVIPVVVECPAAPAIAARLLKAAGVAPRYGRNSNYISDVAHEMGSSLGDMNGSWFWGLPKCINVGGMDVANPAYEAAVLTFLDGLGAFD